MSLRRKFLARQLLALVGVVLLGAAAIWGFIDLRVQLGQALGGQDQTQILQQVMLDTLRVRATLTSTDAPIQQIVADIRQDIDALDGLITQQSPSQNHVCIANSYVQLRQAKLAVHHLKQSEHLLLPPTKDSGQAAAALIAATDDLAKLFTAHTASVHDQTVIAGQRTRIALSSVAGLLAISLGIFSALGAAQYRSILVPLFKLHSRIEKSELANVAGQVDDSSGEFSQVARAFDNMSAELDGLHRGMEKMVVAKSTELVRSERLASVGFLAAGVAHEINNPLNIITGFAELCSRQLAKSKSQDGAVEETLQALQVIRDEAFRCKEITGRLLSLARSGGNERELLSLKNIATDVALMTRGLKNHRERRITLKFNDSQPLNVWANANEMKQVVLNLTVNALEAVASGSGEVRIEGRQMGKWVELSVTDNGRGMSAESIKHVFEPFYTEKRGSAEPGTGLGLTITHAIVQSHGGRIQAESDGLGRGARFTIFLPTYQAAGPQVAKTPRGEA